MESKGADGGGLVISAMRAYVDKMLESADMKVVLLDEETTGIVSMIYTQSDIINKQGA